jgi:hypothetical protein
MGHGVGRLTNLQDEIDPRQALLEGTWVGRGVEHDVAHLVPEVWFILAADDADSALKLLAADPEFAVEGLPRQAGREPGRRLERIALPRQELLAVPESTNRLPSKKRVASWQLDRP